MIPINEHNQIKTIIQQASGLISPSEDADEEMSEEQLDSIVAGVCAPEYQQFVQNIWKKRREGHGPKTDH